MKGPVLAELEAFAAVAQARSFRKAATARGVSPSALSQSLRQLEERLGVRLLNRTTRSVAPTEAGAALLEKLAPALREVAEAVEEAQALGGRPAGTVRINAPAPAVEFVLAPLARDFLAACPEVSLELVSDAARIDIVGGGFDAGVRFGRELARDMIAVPISPALRYVVIAAPAYLAAHGTPRRPEALLAHACLRQRFPGGSVFAWSFERRGRALSLQPAGRLTLSDGRSLVQAAAAGLGLAFVLEDYARPALAGGQVVTVLDDWCPRLPQWFLYYPSRRQMPSGFRAFLDFLAARRSGGAEPPPPV